MNRSDPLYDSKCSYWSRDGGLPSRRLRISVAENESLRCLLSTLRIIVSDEEDLEQLQVVYGGPYGSRSHRDAQGPQNIRNEIRALHHLTAICDDYLSRYPTTLEEDKRRLAAPVEGGDGLAPFSNERHAVIQLRGEKEILHFFKHFSECGIRVLSVRLNSSVEFESILQRYQTTEHPVIYQYCRTVVSRLRDLEIRRMEQAHKNVDLSKPTVV